VDSAFNQDKSKLGVFILSVSLQVSADIDGLLDQKVEIFWDFGCDSCNLEYSEYLSTSDCLDGGDSLSISQQHTDLGGSLALLGQLENLGLDGLGVGLVPRWRNAGIRTRRAGNSLSITVHTTHDTKFPIVRQMQRRNTNSKAAARKLYRKPLMKYRVIYSVRLHAGIRAWKMYS
jgi:hypothetical protein